jgi:hypothetical protein
LAAPAVDVYAIYGALFLPWIQVGAVWFGFLALQTVTAAYAFHLDGESPRSLWVLPLQQIVYRQLMYLVVVQSVVMALIGGRLRWHRMHRTGAVSTLTTRPPAPRVPSTRPGSPPSRVPSARTTQGGAGHVDARRR